MDYEDSPDEAAFRCEFRGWLAGHDPGPEPDASDTLAQHAFRTRWHRTMYEGGWVGLSWPPEYGGRGLTPLHEAIVNEELGAAGIPNAVGPLGWLGRAILVFGTEAQRQQHLPPLLRGDTDWCQGFSEPGAGSDLASLRTSARRDGDVYRLTGQKIWTSGAQQAQWCMVLAKTDLAAAKHKGISCFVVRMDTPGITVNPLKQAWGGMRFAEVFFDDAEVPLGGRIGEEGDGWRLATTVLAYERGPSELGVVATWRAALDELDKHTASDPELAAGVARAHAAVEACRVHLMESLSVRARGGVPGPGSSVDKLLMIRAEQAIGSLELSLAGAEAVAGTDRHTAVRYLWSRASSIYGGAEQIQRNIVAQRILGLPR
jgi:alkylation response protein AidB-like acyl-CoA dehydrogenase